MSSDTLQSGDAVHVIRDGSSTLEGVVAYLGSVDFAPGSDWVGVRLTGSSVGLGKNDGSVQGQKYFDSPPQCGLFVKTSAVTRRQLTRLEELRLRRELASATTTATDVVGAGATATTTPSTGGAHQTPARRVGSTSSSSLSMSSSDRIGRTPASTPASAAAAAAMATSATTPTPSTTAARLEEIRQRRAQLQGGTPGPTAVATSNTPVPSSTTKSSIGSRSAAAVATSPTASTTTASTSTSSTSSSSSLALQRQVKELQDLLHSKTAQIDTLQKDLADAKQDAAQKTTRLEEVESELKLVKTTMTTTEVPIQEQPQQQQQPRSRDGSPSSTDLSQQVATLQAQLDQTERRLSEGEKTFKETIETLQIRYQQGEVDLAAARAEVEDLQKELAKRDASDQEQAAAARNDASHYKERAKLQAEVASLNRRVEQLELDKQELENTVEELTLDKEQLEELKEGLEDRMEEIKLDSETAQMELEETKMELEVLRGRMEVSERVAAAAAASSGVATSASLTSSSEVAAGSSSATTGAGGGGGGSGEEQQAQADMAQNLSIQNARLREALIRLREQSSMEKMDLSRQLRTLEKQIEEAKNLSAEVESLRETRKELEEQISDLKDIVEQGSAYEVMVEDLSDRVLSLEEELVSCQQTIREMEEAADITAEMEEVQTEELKALSRDLEDREAVIRNLEEAIKMQRKREEDFQRTVSNYRSVVETLKQEKKALLELQEGGEGEKSDLVSASQKALARAAQLVQDAAEMRKREAQAAIDRIDSQVRMHLCERLESLLPPSVAAAEIASIKGELLLSKVVGKSSLSLDGIARSFSKTIRSRAWEWRSSDSSKQGENVSELAQDTVVALSDEQQQMAATMIHQSEVAHVAIDVSGDLLWLLSAGQWPDILTTEASAELGAIMGHSMNELDIVLGNVLNTLKEEGVLSPHQSNIGAFRQTVVTTMQTLRSHIEHDGESLVPMDWKPPALKLFRDASRAKYSSLGCYAAVACVLSYGDATKTSESVARSQALIKILKPLLQKLDQAASEAAKSCLRLAHLDVLDESIVAGLSDAASIWRASSDDLLGNIYNMLLAEEGLTTESVRACESATDEVVRVVSHFASILRSANLTDANDDNFHPFSPEVADVWEGVTFLARAIRSKDGDAEDINYLVRARNIEHTLEDAVESVPALVMANTKVVSLEKSLSLRSREIAMQNSRLSELEKLLAKTNAQPSSRIMSSQMVSSEEISSLKQENRVLSEAMDVLHRQVEEYENEIRFLRDAKAPSKVVRSRTPRRSFGAEASSREHSRSGDNLQGLEEENLGAFEAALFRPALQAARRDAAQWKAKATVTTLLQLPPLNVSIPSSHTGEEKVADEDENPWMDISTALFNYQQATASVKLVDLTRKRDGKSPRMQLHEMKMRKAVASDQLDKATATARQWLESHGAGGNRNVGHVGHPLVGRVKFAGPEPVRTIPTPTAPEDLYRLQLHVLQ